MTFKQLEAVYWVVQLGGFAQAANKMHTTQSAVFEASAGAGGTVRDALVRSLVAIGAAD